ncbi:hypothetical protein KIPB_015639, partial [Kipferlia bialata]|eukprot:g15639.t1
MASAAQGMTFEMRQTIRRRCPDYGSYQ